MKIIGWAGPSGSRYWRLGDPFKYLTKRGHEAHLLDEAISDEAAQWAEVYVLNGVVDKEGIATLHAYQKEQGKKLVVDVDDLLTIEPDNPFKMEHDISKAPEVVAITLRVADMVTTTNEFLADKLRAYNDNVVVLPNAMDLERWDLPKLPHVEGRVRIGWAGSITHLKDLEMIVEPLKRIKAKYPQVDLIFVGDMRVRSLFGDTPVEVSPGVPFEWWPRKLHSLRLDIGLAPLRDTEFNRAKSDIKYQEYSIAGVPGVYSPTAYRGTIVTPDDWYKAIEELVTDAEQRSYSGRVSYENVVDNCSLASLVVKWEQAYRSLFH